MSEEVVPPMDENEKRIVNEFCHLLEKSKQLFNGLRLVSPGLLVIFQVLYFFLIN